MVFRKFRLNIIVRATIILLLFTSLYFSTQQKEWYLTSIVLGLIVILCFIELVFYVEKSNRMLADFLNNIKNKDFTGISSKKVQGYSYTELNNVFNTIYNEFKNIKIEKEIHYEYIQLLLAHIDVGILCIDQNGKISFQNKAFTDCFSIQVRHLDDFAKIDINLLSKLKELNPTDKFVYRYKKDEEIIQLSIGLSIFRIKDQLFKMYSFKNIKEELENKELESWQMLIRVISHEIMNSTTPILSLTTAIKEILFDEFNNRISLNDITKDDSEEIYEGIAAIERKSKGMIDFVSAYKNLTRIPKPNIESFKAIEFLEQIQTLFKKKLSDQNIDLTLNIDSDLEITADKSQLEQVIINLLNNAIDAVENQAQPKIEIIATKNEKTLFCISNNGESITEDELEKIFIPFYTTKNTGSGVGLSICKQIIRMHNGKISAISNEHKTTFIILL